MEAYHANTDRELTVQLKQGDRIAFEQLYLIYSPRIYKKILQLVKNVALAEELLQDVFVKIWEKRELIDTEKSFKSFLYRIAQNLVTDLFRRAALDRKMMQTFIAESTELYSPFDEAEESYSKAILEKAMSTLPPQRKRVYTLIKIEGKSYEEVSALLGISVSTVNDHVVKATKTLKGYFNINDATTIALVAAIIATF
ncbi:RNA polymerase sigma factor [Pedobacter frigoris]|uniref:RNA polymerase sigma factor n=1 Tax=Pedobacter frigoris TaxID=2571272 RepID=UPI00292DF9C7|nr:sigma-70 family RNA polymerase sigma factor [Pedobacter frigoris]